MSFRRVGVLLGKELLQGPKSFVFIWAVVAPIAISLVLSLVFGTLFAGKARLGIVDEGSSQLVAKFEKLNSVAARKYGTVPEVLQAVESGAVDMGIVLPKDFDSSIEQGKKAELIAYVWGESLAKNRTILGVTIADAVREMAGQESPVEINSVSLGDKMSIPWNDRLLPLIVLITVIIGGAFLPATSIVNEKEKNTLQALVITPASMGDVFLAKGLLGIILGLFMGIVLLVLNQAFGAEPMLLILVLGLGAVMAAEFGLLFGAATKDITTLFAIWKSLGIVIMAPALIYLFPEIPEWIAKIFPTYYLIQPIVEISQRGGGWPEISTQVLILIALDLLLIGVVAITLKRTNQLTA